MYHLTLAGKVNTNRGLLCTCTCQLQLMLRFGFGSASCRVCHTIRSRSLMACHLENNPTWEVPSARFIYLLLGTRPRFRPSNINKGLNLYSQYSNSRHVSRPRHARECITQRKMDGMCDFSALKTYANWILILYGCRVIDLVTYKSTRVSISNVAISLVVPIIRRLRSN